MGINLTVPNNSETPELKPRITVVGVGGAGGNAVNNMIQRELGGVDFVVTNTDAQALSQSKAERRIQLGAHLTQGLGAGAKPEIGRAAAEEAVDTVLSELKESHMAFIAAGMGGGTGTGAAPVLARAAREAGILTVGVVTKPFQFEGSHRMTLAEQGIKELEQFVDTLIVIPNQNLFRIANESTTFSDAFAMADQVLYSGVRGVTDLIVMPGLINLDFADIRSVMSEMGKAMMGTGEAEGERRALDAAEAAIANPLLEDMSMKGAKGVLINITGSDDITLFEVDEAATRIRSEVDEDARIIVGSAFDPGLEGKMRVSVVATGIDADASRAPAPITLSVRDEPQKPEPVMVEPDPEPEVAPPAEVVAEETVTEAPEPVEPAAEESPALEAEAPGEDKADEVADQVEEETVAEPPSALEMLIQAAEEKAIKDEPVRAGGAEPETAPEAPVTQTVAPEPETAEAEKSEADAKKPVFAAPALGATDAFIPPKPATPAGQDETPKPDPFRAADMANGGGKEKDGSEGAPSGRRPSLFERVTRTGRAAIERVGGNGNSQGSEGSDKAPVRETKMSTTPIPSTGGTPAPLRAVNAQAEIAGLSPSPVAREQEEPESDDLDIPAFLRRQAN